jgi:hypothetical protein
MDDLQRKLAKEHWADMDRRSRALGGAGLPPFPNIQPKPEGGEMTGPLGGLSSRNFPKQESPSDKWRRGE